MATKNETITEREWALLANIGALFRELREEAGLSQKAAARLLGTSQARFPVLENGQADVMITTLQRHASLYGYDVEVSVVKKPVEGDHRINDDGDVEKFVDGYWEEVQDGDLEEQAVRNAG